VSELELGKIQTGQPVQVRLDAFPTRTFTGQVSRVSPAADPTSRQIPIEVTIPNARQEVGSGLLARVIFPQQTMQRVVVPETALSAHEDRRSPQRTTNAGPDRGGTGTSPQPTTRTDKKNQASDRAGILFVIRGSGKQTTAESRQVTLGSRQDGQVEILAGLRTGERFVARSSKALKDGDRVRLSIISEGVEPKS
jgi:multidrug efflux pump subunit AcrA (membrane-fusion protein)